MAGLLRGLAASICLCGLLASARPMETNVNFITKPTYLSYVEGLQQMIEKKFNGSNVITATLERWVKVENKHVHPFRQRGKCWYGFDGNVSQMQLDMDEYCAATNGGITMCARCENIETLKCYCVQMIMIDYSSDTNQCLNNCSSPTKCAGTAEILKTYKNVDPTVIKRLHHKYCVNSNLQRSLDRICGEGMAARFQDPDIRCFPKTALDYAHKSSCWDECGFTTECFGKPPESPSGRDFKPTEINWDDMITESNRSQFIKNYCRNIRKGHPTCYVTATTEETCAESSPKSKYTTYVEKTRLDMYLQPGSIFDLWITPYIPTYEISIRFSEEDKGCTGDLIADSPIVQSYASQPYDVYTGKWSLKYAKRGMDIHPALDGTTKTYQVIKGFKVMRDVNTTVNVCACLSSLLYYRYSDNMACSSASQFTIYLGKIHICGKLVPLYVNG
ncbi:hypothetical protein BBBOND_0404230 [Babesia bigemina]|uniref:Uncharacterized protein n=1 Tax=Babesia bigemina TaxID=5866 RepID=A0A061DEV4_BABBI|nr:hypothetical protein BBBOND_0404230 [Babesia bigemina]CDR97935.1 hypothetical protein BBBOND_0404230 [Babesia bigemina]|eukprot:XP_012770121.1 hypothetical protein BBBOND_0404230 [Babesia bigemina]